ncbi:MAG: GIY-YIG nuclease family protein [Boseongicola sp. SB0673_bin_14]|nr:GIY-YIG nuclease family protein [Boseongicola sp. SB0673_bin_14]
MSTLLGRTVRLFLVDGEASGLVTAEIMNRTGHVLAGSRSGLQAFMKRPELDRTGIYFLTGPDPEDPETTQVYVGESDVVRKRLLQHSNDESKDFWERVCVVTSKDKNITKAHARFLEARLIAIARASDNASVMNGTAPSPIPLPEADESDMEFFIEQIRLIFPVLGFNFLRQYRGDAQTTRTTGTGLTHRDDTPVFRLVGRKRGVEAQAQEIGGEFVVLEGSTAVAAWSSGSDHSYAKRHAQLARSNKLVAAEGGVLRFAENVAFRSPSAASAIILGRPDNGRRSWKLAGPDVSYGDWQSRQLAAAASTSDADGVT